MLYYRTLNEKTQMYDKYLEGQVYNFLDKTFVIPQDFEFNLFTVEDQYVMRPDLISKDAYGDSMYADIICKLNGISNPFELNEDDTLTIPRVEEIMFYSRPNKQGSELVSGASAINKSKTSKQKELNKKRSPNEQVVGDKNYVIDKSLGLVFY